MASHDDAVNIIFGAQISGPVAGVHQVKEEMESVLAPIDNIICCTASMAYRQLARRYRGGLGGHGF
jgi:hypothetical protein